MKNYFLFYFSSNTHGKTELLEENEQKGNDDKKDETKPTSSPSDANSSENQNECLENIEKLGGDDREDETKSTSSPSDANSVENQTSSKDESSQKKVTVKNSHRSLTSLGIQPECLYNNFAFVQGREVESIPSLKSGIVH